MGQAGGYVLALHHAGLRSRQISLSWRLPLPESSRRVSWNVHFRADDSSSENSASVSVHAICTQMAGETLWKTDAL